MWYVLVHTGKKYTTFTHVHLLYKQNSPLSRLDFFSAALVKTSNIKAEKLKFYCSTVFYFTLADLLQSNKAQETKVRYFNSCFSIHFASVFFDEK